MSKVLLLLAALAVISWGCTPVDGDRIMGADLAREHPSFSSIAADLDLGPSPLAGARRTFAYFEVERIARDRGVLLEAGAKREACFARTTVQLSEEQLRRALAVPPEIQILDFSRGPLPVGRLEFAERERERSGWWRGRWLYGDHRSVPIWVRLSLDPQAAPVSALSVKARPPVPEIGRGDAVHVEIQTGGILPKHEHVLGFEPRTTSGPHWTQRPRRRYRFAKGLAGGPIVGRRSDLPEGRSNVDAVPRENCRPSVRNTDIQTNAR